MIRNPIHHPRNTCFHMNFTVLVDQKLSKRSNILRFSFYEVKFSISQNPWKTLWDTASDVSFDKVKLYPYRNYVITLLVSG